ncbi:MAG: suppressor of glycerol defect [Bathelium mastoideum]|nr:MAG: suppressor of glycerol defect [Bathelium mastoideum]
MRIQKHATLKLPKQLLDQLGDSSSSSRTQASRNRYQSIGRKEKRKAEREQKKSLNQNYPKVNVTLGARKGTKIDRELSKDESDSESSLSPEPRPTKSTVKSTKLAAKPTKSTLDPVQSTASHDDDKETVLRLSKGVRDQLTRDDTEIAALEKKLGLKGKKTQSSKAFLDDGLDDLIGGIDEDKEASIQGSKRKNGKDEEWLLRKRRKLDVVKKGSVRDHRALSVNKTGDAISREVDNEIEGLLSGEEQSATSQDSEESNPHDEQSGSDFDGFGPEETEEQPSRIRENPYIAPVSAGAVSAAKYIPPSLRETSTSDEEAMRRLRRRVQGLLNRLSEANLVTMLRDVERLYSTNPRQHVSSSLIDLLLGSIRDATTLNDTFLILLAGFLTALYTVVGVDFGGQLIEMLVQEFDRQYQIAQSSDTAGKETSNIMSFFAQLYNFQVIGSTLIYDYIRLFLQDLSELNTELLLRIIKSCGSQLRQDDPTSLKDIIMLLQKSVGTADEANLSVRTKFMIETITNLKNNRVKNGAAASAIAHEHTVRMKKTLGALRTRSGKTREPFRVTLNDIRDGQKKGKWWLIGASWNNPHTSNTNEPPETSLAARPDSSSKDISSNNIHDKTTNPELDLNALATHQRINNPLRRTIFLALLSATDARDASLRVQNLRLKRSQQAEVPRVLLQCCGAEAAYNPYYALVARRLCDADGRSAGHGSGRKRREGVGQMWGLDGGEGEGSLDVEGKKGAGKRMRFAFAAAVWDVWRGMGEGQEDDGDEQDENERDMSMRKVVNLAKMVGALVVDGVLDIMVLKTLNLPYLRSKTRTFVEIMLVTIIQHGQSPPGAEKRSRSYRKAALISIFSKAGENPELAAGLQYFLKTHVARSDIVASKKEAKVLGSACEVIKETLSAIAVGRGDANTESDVFSD